MTLSAPTLEGFTSNVVELSKLKDSLKVLIPNSATISPLDDIWAALGENEETPDWCGAKVQAGEWNDETEDVERKQDLRLDVPKTALEKYLKKTVTLRYQTSGESNLVASSSPLSLRIEP
jgi:hypothetical protein